MTETRRTLIFVVVAAVFGGAAYATYKNSIPRPTGEYERVGTEFFPDFKDPSVAKSLKVVVFNEELATIKPFTVEFKDGRWRIPSHHNYPADAKDRLAKTAASIVGITRDALQSRRASDHAKYGVVDPEIEDATILKGRGQRLTLSDGDGNILADYIIGKKVEGQPDQYYVRGLTDKKDDTYRVRLKIDLSTKFGDWIEPDLLKLDRYALRELTVDKYSLQQRGDSLALVGKEISELTRTSDTDPWKLQGLDDKTQEVNADAVRDVEGHLDNLKIEGVRPKPQGIRPDLSVDPKIARDPLVRIALQQDLQDKGYFVGPDEKDKESLHLYSTEGEMLAGTNEGVRYALHFGQIFTGTEFEIEVGFANKNGDEAGEKKTDGEKKAEDKKEAEAAKSDEPAKDKKKEDGKKQDAEGAEKKTDDKSPAKKRSRYLFVTTSFDEKLIGGEPTKPVEPKKPEGLPEEKPAEPNSKTPAPKDAPKDGAKKEDSTNESKGDSAKPKGEKSDDTSAKDESNGEEEELDGTELAEAEKASGDKEKADGSKNESNQGTESKPTSSGKSEEKKSDEKKGDEGKTESKPGNESKAEDAKPTEVKPDPKAEYEKALTQYKKDLEKYENDLSQHKSKIEKGKKKVDELNKRFGGWYYVISAESFENLRLARKDLVKPKEEKKDGDKANPGAQFNLPGGLPGGIPPGIPGGEPGEK